MKLLSLALVAAMTMGLASCGGSAKTEENAAATDSDSVAAATEQAAPAAAQDYGTLEEGVYAYTGNEEIRPAEKPIIMDFNAKWCGPCKKFTPIFHKVAKDYQDKVIFLMVDVDVNPTTKAQFEANNIPQVSIVLPDGTITNKEGLMTEEEFKAMVEGTLK